MAVVVCSMMRPGRPETKHQRSFSNCGVIGRRNQGVACVDFDPDPTTADCSCLFDDYSHRMYPLADCPTHGEGRPNGTTCDCCGEDECIGPPVEIKPEPDPVNHPSHYTSHPSGVETIVITEHMNFNLGNAVKYIMRAGLKGDAVEDLEKASWYVRREIDRLNRG